MPRFLTSWFPAAAGLAALAGVAFTAPAHAVPLNSASSITVGDLTISTYTPYCTTTACNAGEYVAFGNGIKIQGAGGGVFQSGFADSSVWFKIESSAGLISGVTLSMAGTGDGSTVGEQVFTLGGLGIGSLTVGSPDTLDPSTAHLSFAPVSGILVNKDIATDDFFTGITNPQTFWVTQSFDVPEPAAFGLLMVGFGAAVVARRRKV